MHSRGKKIDIFLQPGEYFVGDADYRIRTLLGSCVSIVLWHPVKKVGAMSHFLLSARIESDVAGGDGRYAEEALALMLQELKREGVRPRECEAKIFGGGNMFPKKTGLKTIDVGRKNGETARTILGLHGIPIISESLFGVGHRQVIFDIERGHVWSRQIRPMGTP